MHRHFGMHREHRGRHPFGGRMGHGHHRGGRTGRLLDHGDLRFVILAMVKEKPSHGYELMRDLEERTGGVYRPSPGVIYPTLSLLEDEGLVRQAGGDSGRKLYEITPAGEEALAANAAAVAGVFARLDEASSQAGPARPRVQRAMQNLSVALVLRVRTGGLTEQQIDAIAAAIDEAASKIERV
jgi:DNA-binding PadR family transcriptional regulator